MDAKYLEKLMMKACMADKSFMITVGAVFRPEYFDDPTIIKAFEFMKEHVEKYGNVPPKDAIIATFPDKADDLRELFEEVECIDFDVVRNWDYLFDETNKYLKDKAIKSAILESVEIINQNPDDRVKIREIVESALCKDLKIDIGLDYFNTLGERLKRIFATSLNRIPTYYPQFDEYLNGGFPPFTFSVVVARVHGFKCVHGNTDIIIKDNMNNVFCIKIQDFYKYIETVNKYRNGELNEMPSMESFIRKYGDKGKEKYFSWKENVGKASKNRNTKDFFISKYGEVVGEERYSLYIERQKVSHSEQTRGREKHREISSRSGNNKDSYVKKVWRGRRHKKMERKRKKVVTNNVIKNRGREKEDK